MGCRPRTAIGQTGNRVGRRRGEEAKRPKKERKVLPPLHIRSSNARFTWQKPRFWHSSVSLSPKPLKPPSPPFTCLFSSSSLLHSSYNLKHTISHRLQLHLRLFSSSSSSLPPLLFPFLFAVADSLKRTASSSCFTVFINLPLEAEWTAP